MTDTAEQTTDETEIEYLASSKRPTVIVSGRENTAKEALKQKDKQEAAKTKYEEQTAELKRVARDIRDREDIPPEVFQFYSGTARGMSVYTTYKPRDMSKDVVALMKRELTKKQFEDLTEEKHQLVITGSLIPVVREFLADLNNGMGDNWEETRTYKTTKEACLLAQSMIEEQMKAETPNISRIKALNTLKTLSEPDLTAKAMAKAPK